MSQLDARFDILAVDEVDHPSPGVDLLLIPDPWAVGTDPSLRQHAGGLSHDQPSLASGIGPQGDQMPVTDDPVYCGVLTHGCQPGTVGKLHPTNRQGSEELGHEASQNRRKVVEESTVVRCTLG